MSEPTGVEQIIYADSDEVLRVAAEAAVRWAGVLQMLADS